MLEGFEPLSAEASNRTGKPNQPSHSVENLSANEPNRTVLPNVQLDFESQTAVQQAVREASQTHQPTVADDAAAPTLRIPECLTGKTVVLVDSHSLIYQIFHALAPMSSPTGMPVAALYGFLRDIADLRDRWQPAYLWCTFDRSEETFRNLLFPAYKAHRDPMPEELRLQLPIIHQALKLIGVGVVDADGFEADDILATLSTEVSSRGGKSLIVTSDKDCRQLISDQVQLLNIRKGELFGAVELDQTWGIRPEQVVDFQALVGDAVDGVPGVPLIGPKLAQELLSQFGTLERVLENHDKVSGRKRAENLVTFRDQAILSQTLARLKRDVPLQLDWRTADFSQKDNTNLKEFFREYGIRRLAERFLDEVSPDEHQTQVSPANYRLVDSLAALDDLVVELRSAKLISFDTETTSINARWAEPVGYSFAWDVGKAAYIPLRAPSGNRTLDPALVSEKLRQVLGDPAIAKIGHNLKYDLIVFRAQEVLVRGVAFDTMVADYLIDPGQRDHSLDDVTKRYLKQQSIPISQLIGTGRKQLTMDQVDLPLITQYACEDADIPWRLRILLHAKLENDGLRELFETVEMPLVEVLAEMEFNGIRVDAQMLQNLSDRFASRIDSLHDQIIELAGEQFNLDSPKQLAKILFTKLNLPIVKKTKTGPSTDAEVLQELAPQHALPSKLLEYRQLTKLKSTYIDALPTMICPKTGRVHTSFRQDVAATGRLSSTDPNLQNIPIRGVEGREIRSAFLPGPMGWLLLAADYSQIELRVLAHYCKDENLLSAFQQDLDIHSQVASQVYGVPLAEVSSAQRRNAKAINFGIIYGQSPFGLAKALQISKEAAAEFIDAYFARLPGVRKFIVETIDTCRRQGYVSTLFGRRRQLKGVRDFSSLDEAKRRVLMEPERMAVNTVIQGSAADLIKVAMLRVHRRLQSTNLQAKLLLQIHDELVLEVAPEDRDVLAILVREEMVAAARLDVPLRVDVKSGLNWADCEPIQ